jgi:hypothetical protein
MLIVMRQMAARPNMMGGKSEAALATFKTLVDEDPDYASLE